MVLVRQNRGTGSDIGPGACRVIAAIAIGACALAPSALAGSSADDQAERLRRAAFTRCAMCHQVGPNARNGTGPVLNGVIGRRAAAVVGFSYSEALRQSRIVWTEEELRRFLRAPGARVPGTRMAFSGIRDEALLDVLIAYVRSFSGAIETRR